MKGQKLRSKAVELRTANEFILALHRHHKKIQGHRFSVGCEDETGKLVGVVTVGRPSARMLQDGVTVEVTRLCTDGTPNACSFLYSKAARIAQELGYKRIITYILAEESGHSLKATGWTKDDVDSKGGCWDRPNLGRIGNREYPQSPKQRWSK